MLFSEIYGSYFRVVSEILNEAVNNTLDNKKIYNIITEKAFSESILNIPSALKGGEWNLITDDFHTPIKNSPSMPLTKLQKQWLKSLLTDPKIQLFNPPADGLEDIEPLFSFDMFEYFDRYSDGDPYSSESYIKNFRTILAALNQSKKLIIHYNSSSGKHSKICCAPYKLEYSQKDDKFRLIAVVLKNTYTINISRIESCNISDTSFKKENLFPKNIKSKVILKLIDKRNALERAMLHFSHLEKETERINENTYKLTLYYDIKDETEILIRVLSFGPMLKVISPQKFINQVKDRIEKQKLLNNQPTN